MLSIWSCPILGKGLWGFLEVGATIRSSAFIRRNKVHRSCSLIADVCHLHVRLLKKFICLVMNESILTMLNISCLGLFVDQDHTTMNVKSSLGSRTSFFFPSFSQCCLPFNPFPHDKILDQTKLKVFADNKLYGTKMEIFVFGKVENIVGKGEIACTSDFFFSHNVLKGLLS